MTALTRLTTLLVTPLAIALQAAAQQATPPLVLTSPNGALQASLRLDDQGRAGFEVASGGEMLVTGTLGLEFADSGRLVEHLQITGSRRRSREETYAIPVGKASSAADRHNELIISLAETVAPHHRLDVAFRAFDDGVAFRYMIPTQDSLSEFVLTDEHTLLTFPGNPTARVLPLKDFTTPYEAYYETRTLPHIENDVGSLIALPMLVEHPLGTWIVVTEADLTDYAGMYLVHPPEHPQSLKTALSPLPDEVAPEGLPPASAKVVGWAPFHSPWRVLMIADDPGRLIESNLIFHLNRPAQIVDTSWIRPGKTTFPWWNHYVLEGVDFERGVNTATMKHYIDFCAEYGIPYHSLDGLDIAWYGGPIRPDGPTDVTTAAPSIDMPELLRYAKQKGVRLRLWMHWKALQPQLDEAFATYERWGIEGVMIDFMDRDDQQMVRWYHDVARKAAEHHLTVTWHGAYKPTGMERTWPNVLSYEAVLNQEYNKWQPPGVKGTPPGHNLDAAFVRMLAGPLDYHQGGMRNVLPENYRFRDVAPPVQGTRGHQLAMYVVYQNHLPMMADYPAAYHDQPELPFLVQIPTTWDETRVLHAEFERCLVIARRSGRDWYVGGMTADSPQSLKLSLDFLGEGAFDVEVFRDAPDAGPTVTAHERQTMTSQDTFAISMSRSGGFAARLIPTESD